MAIDVVKIGGVLVEIRLSGDVIKDLWDFMTPWIGHMDYETMELQQLFYILKGIEDETKQV